MKLYTECTWGDWHKVVDIYSERCDILPEYINDDSTYKIVILEKGSLLISKDGKDQEIKAPVLILLNNEDRLNYKTVKPVKACIVFFKPAAIRDEFDFERVGTGEFEKTQGQIIYQDYLLIRCFLQENQADRVTSLPVTGLKHMKALFTAMDKELRTQKDGFWPCRSRSYLIELLHYIVYSYYTGTPDAEDESEDSEKAEFAKVSEYLEQNLSENITLSVLTLKFAMNRNKLNDLFMKYTSMTWLNYLLNLRMDLAKILLSKTELPVGEIGARVGYPDSSYFSKVFREQTGAAPSAYRKLN